MSFGQTVGCLVLKRSDYCVLVAHQAASELHQFWQVACLSLCQPGLQCLRLSFPQEEEKGQDKLLRCTYLWAVAPELLKVPSLLGFQLSLWFHQKPPSLSR